MAPRKRKEPEDGDDAPSTSKVPAKKLSTDVEFDSRWKQEKPSLLYLGDDLESSKKIAAFDFDNTLVEWLEGVPAFSAAPDSWEFWSDEVPKKLKALTKDGYKIAIFSNQATIKTALGGAAAKNFRAKIDAVLKSAGVQAAAYVATMKPKEGVDPYRKPATGMWEHFLEHCNGGVEVDKESSFYVGDAAGRPQDFSDSDKQFAEAIGLPFKTPEEVFGASSRPNKDMASCFRKLAEEVMASGDDKAFFRRNAYIKAANAVEFCKEKITSGKQAGKLKGVGKGSVAHVEEFLEDGVMGERAKKEKAEKEEGKAEDDDEAGAKEEGDATNKAEGGDTAAGGGGGKKAKAGLAFLD